MVRPGATLRRDRVWALQKLRDVEAFSNSFLAYDLLAQRSPRYAYVYRWAQALVGVLMIAGALTWL